MEIFLDFIYFYDEIQLIFNTTAKTSITQLTLVHDQK